MAAAGYVPMKCPPVNGAIPDNCEELAPEPQTEMVKNFMLITFCIIPTLATVVGSILKCYYPINNPDEQLIKILAAAEQHKRGLAATDPITGALIGPLCISRLPLNDPKRKPMLALAHFSVGDLRRFNAAGRNISFLRSRLNLQYAIVFTIWVAFSVVTASHFHLLDNMAWGWVPIMSLILAGAMVIFLYVVGAIRAKLPVLENEVTQEILDMYLAKWDTSKTVETQGVKM